MAKSLSISLLVLTLSGVAIADGQAAGSIAPPMEVVRTSNEAIQVILDEHDPLDAEGEARVYEVMDRVTDFDAMSNSAINGVCEDSGIPEDKCGEWKAVFSDLLRIRSIKGVGRYRADRFDYLNEETDGEQAVVNTLAYYEGDEVTLDYELARTDEKWVIVNYVVDDVDTVRSYNRRFKRLLRNETVDDVIARLQARIEELREES